MNITPIHGFFLGILIGIVLFFSGGAHAVEYWATQAGAGAQDGSSLENAWPQGSIVYGGANAAGRGDILYLCGTRAAPITASITPSSIGAWTNPVDNLSDVFIISGNAEKCGGEQGYLAPAASYALRASVGGPAIYMQEMTCADAPASCFETFLSTGTAACTAAAGFYCSLQKDLTCYNSATTTFGHCATLIPLANTNFPGASIEGILQENVTSYDGGGAACNIRMRATGATQRNCRSFRDGKISNVWGVYQSGVTLNTGAGSGVTWLTLSGGAANARKVAQTAFGASAGATILDVYSPVSAEGVVGDLALDGTCTGDSDCATDAGTWGQVGDTLYINLGSATPSAAAAVYVTYAWNDSPIIENSYAEEFRDTWDGYGIGLDFGTRNGVIRRSYAKDNSKIGIACGAGALNCTIQSSISTGGATANIRMGGGGGTVENVSAANSGNGIAITARTKNGETITVRNVAAEASDVVLSDTATGNDGTLTEITNSLTPQFIGGPTPTTAEGSRLKPTSPLIGAGVVGAKYDYDNKRCGNPSNIGAFCTTYQDTRSSYTTRTDY